MILCAVVAAGYYTGHWYLSRQNHIKVLANRRYEFVQGVVENLHPMPDDGSSKESFTISGHIFLYSDYDELGTTNCFDQTQPHGGPIHNGMLLRVKFIDDCILRLEVPSENSVVNDK
ncbi:MAG TPA: hypothetical protein VN982_14135 [Candidatus Dormibacteraeota bacterium]|nr:hypothetical protein [Candidatus Dormibacteraeota bacterium]